MYGGGNGGKGGDGAGYNYVGAGGGGAGGYGGNGGAGAKPFPGFIAPTAAATGSGGGGGGSANTSNADSDSGSGGGGVGLLGTDGLQGYAGYVGTGGYGGPSGGGGGGSGGGAGANEGGATYSGPGGSYGGGGAGDNLGDGGASGGLGAVRIIWPSTKIADGTAYRSFGATVGTTLLATDQSGTLVENASIFTVTIPSSYLNNLNISNTWTVQSWDPEILPQSNVSTIAAPSNPRERLYYANLARSKFGISFPNLSNIGSLPVNVNTDRLSNIDTQYWTAFNNPNAVVVGQSNPKLPNSYIYSLVASQTTNGANTVLTYNPISGITGISLSSTYYGSFNGSSSQLVFQDSPRLVLAGGVWTIEYWFFTTGDYSIYRTMFAKRVGFSANCSYEGYLRVTTGVISFYNGTNYESTVTPTANIWHHTAYVYDGTNIIIYLDGVNVYQTPVTITDYSTPLSIGGTTTVAEQFLGSISNFRIVKGIVVYTGNFTTLGPLSTVQPSRTNVRALSGTETSLLTLQNSSPTIDNSVSNGPIQPTYMSSTVNYAGFNGLNQNLSLAYTPIQTTAAAPFTIECWVYNSAFASGIVATSAYGGSGTIPYCIGFTNQGDPSFPGPYPYFSSYNGSSWNIFLYSPTACVLNTWYHFAVSYDGTTLRLFINGSQVNSLVTGAPAQTTLNVGGGYYIGRRWDLAGNNYFNGYISNLRFVKGVGVYAGNFTPQGPLSRVQTARLNVAALTGSETVILTLQNDATIIDNSVLGTAITNTNNVLTATSGQIGYNNSSAVVGILSTSSGTVPLVGDYLLVTDTVTTNQSLAPINAVVTNANLSYTVSVPTTSVVNLSLTNAWTSRLWDPEVMQQVNVATNTAPTTPRERLYYSQIVPGKYGITLNKSPIGELPTNVKAGGLSNIDSNYWKMLSDSNVVAVGQANIKLVNNISLNAQVTAASSGGNTVLSYTPTYYGTFNGTSQYLSIPNINFSTNNFTIEGWFYPTSIGSYVSFWGTDMGGGANPKLAMYIQSGGGNLYVDYGGTIVISVSASSIITTNAWNHIALVRTGTGTNQTALYVNGISKATGTIGSLSTITNPFNIGYIGETGLTLFPGYISNFRIVNKIGRAHV